MSDHDEIYLQPECCVDPEFGRVWCDHSSPDDSGEQWTKYIRADLVPQWQPIETAPKDGSRCLVYRPLAHKTNDANIDIKKIVGGNNFCWPETVPDGEMPTNPTDGACHATHWMPLPEATK